MIREVLCITEDTQIVGGFRFVEYLLASNIRHWIGRKVRHIIPFQESN